MAVFSSLSFIVGSFEYYIVRVIKWVFLFVFFKSVVSFHRKYFTLHILLMTWREISIWTRGTKSASIWRPISSKCAALVA